MHLENHARFQVLFLDGVLDTDHGNLNQISVASLDGHIDCFSFKRLSLIVRQAAHIREETFPAKKRVYISLFACLIEGAFHVLFDVWERFVIAFNKL